MTGPRIAVIGLGAMGLPMATRLAAAFPVIGFDPFDARRDLAAESGVAAVATPGEAAGEADIVLLAVRDQAQAEEALFGSDGVTSTLNRRVAGHPHQHRRAGSGRGRWPTGWPSRASRSSTPPSAVARCGPAKVTC